MTKKAVIRIIYKNGVVADVGASGDIEEFVAMLRKDGDVQNVELRTLYIETARKNPTECMKKGGC